MTGCGVRLDFQAQLLGGGRVLHSVLVELWHLGCAGISWWRLPALVHIALVAPIPLIRSLTRQQLQVGQAGRRAGGQADGRAGLGWCDGGAISPPGRNVGFSSAKLRASPSSNLSWLEVPRIQIVASDIQRGPRRTPPRSDGRQREDESQGRANPQQEVFSLLQGKVSSLGMASSKGSGLPIRYGERLRLGQVLFACSAQSLSPWPCLFLG